MANSGTATLALVRDTFREAFARKIFWGFFGCSTAVILFFIFLMKIDVVEGALATISLFGNESRATDVTNLVRSVHGSLLAFLYGVGLFFAVFASAGLIPTIFEPGRIELLLSKPVRRGHILLGRYLGTLLVVSFNLLYLVVSIWLILGIKTGIWTYQFLFSTALGPSGVAPVRAALVPADTIMLSGVRMAELRATPLYQKLIAEQRMSEINDFAKQTGFDPRKDVQELLAASDGADTVVLARGAFKIQPPAGFRPSTYKG